MKINTDNYYVYMHVNKINNKKYIGITKNKPEDRWQNGKGYKKQAFYKAIQKYGWDNFYHIILFDNLSEEEACKKEIELIAFYKSDNKKFGYNISHGGENGHNDLWNDDEYRKAQIEERKRRWDNKEYRNKLAESMKKAMSTNTYKEKQADKTKARWENGDFDDIHKCKVICLETGIIYGSIEEASKLTKSCRANIGKCCRGNMKTANGFHWQYYNQELDSEEYRQYLIDYIGKGHYKKIQCIETGKIYNSIKEASIETNVNYSTLASAVKGRLKTCGGYHWKIA